jgi:hypothetical protein
MLFIATCEECLVHTNGSVQGFTYVLELPPPHKFKLAFKGKKYCSRNMEAHFIVNVLHTHTQGMEMQGRWSQCGTHVCYTAQEPGTVRAYSLHHH